jgi:hypothetical protein
MMATAAKFSITVPLSEHDYFFEKSKFIPELPDRY